MQFFSFTKKTQNESTSDPSKNTQGASTSESSSFRAIPRSLETKNVPDGVNKDSTTREKKSLEEEGDLQRAYEKKLESKIEYYIALKSTITTDWLKLQTVDFCYQPTLHNKLNVYHWSEMCECDLEQKVE